MTAAAVLAVGAGPAGAVAAEELAAAGHCQLAEPPSLADGSIVCKLGKNGQVGAVQAFNYTCARCGSRG
eukprot:2120899-Pleurochrysis_carterae.AAC.1